jgi:hypothetical protein
MNSWRHQKKENQHKKSDSPTNIVAARNGEGVHGMERDSQKEE